MEIPLSVNGCYFAPEVLDLFRTQDVDFVLGLPAPRVLRRHFATLEASTIARTADGATVRHFKEGQDGSSWSQVERIIARVEAGPRGYDTCFSVTSLTKGTVTAALRKRLLRQWPGRGLHQSVEGQRWFGLSEQTRRRPHLMPQRRRQAAPACSFTSAGRVT